MEWFAHHRQRVIVALAVTAPLAVAAVLVPARASLTNAATALILVVVILAIAIGGGRACGYVASVSATLWFDFFFTHPYYSFDIHGRIALEITICLLVVGLAVSELAARSRHHQRVSSEESGYVAMVRELTDLAQTSPGSSLIGRAEPMLIDLLHLRAQVALITTSPISRWRASWRTARSPTWVWRGRPRRSAYPVPKRRSWPSGTVARLGDSSSRPPPVNR